MTGNEEKKTMFTVSVSIHTEYILIKFNYTECSCRLPRIKLQ